MFFALRKMGLAPALGAKYFWIELAFSAPRRIAITIVLGTRQTRICVGLNGVGKEVRENREY